MCLSLAIEVFFQKMALQRATVKKKKKERKKIISSLCIYEYSPWSMKRYDKKKKKKKKNAAGNLGLIPGLGKSPGEGNDYLL